SRLERRSRSFGRQELAAILAPEAQWASQTSARTTPEPADAPKQGWKGRRSLAHSTRSFCFRQTFALVEVGGRFSDLSASQRATVAAERKPNAGERQRQLVRGRRRLLC